MTAGPMNVMLREESDRAIAEALGVDNTTIDEDVRGGKPPRGARKAKRNRKGGGETPQQAQLTANATCTHQPARRAGGRRGPGRRSERVFFPIS